MLTVSEAAEQLNVSPQRVRALIKAGTLPASKHGRAWVIREEDVLQRCFEHPHSGRPKRKEPEIAEQELHQLSEQSELAHEAYELCRRLFTHIPSADLMTKAESKEEASFYMAASDFFLQQKQAELVANGTY